MLKIRIPSSITYGDVLTTCASAITGNKSLKENLLSSVDFLKTAATDYSARATNATLFQLQRSPNGNPTVIGSLQKNELIKLYEYYFVEKRSGGFYDKLLQAANEKCPFCGGIGLPANLDHFMPKNGYPQFSVLPDNLVPSCRDCNLGDKKSDYATTAAEQIIHPFLDADHFFNEQWIFAQYHPAKNGSPSRVDYHPSPPTGWSQQDKKRVQKHFSDFDIGRKYGVQAATELAGIESQIQAIKQLNARIDFRPIILQPLVNAEPFANHWKRVMCLALIKDIR